jgi:hypothetical protein
MKEILFRIIVTSQTYGRRGLRSRLETEANFNVVIFNCNSGESWIYLIEDENTPCLIGRN